MDFDVHRIIDISLPVRPDMPVFEGNPAVELELQQAIALGDEANVSSLTLGVHTGTHVDAPFHFFEGGAAVESLALEAMIGEAVVVDASSTVGHVDATALQSLPIPESCERLLIKTRNSELWSHSQFTPEFQGLTSDGAAYLVARRIRLVGWDYLSIGPFGNAVETHRRLLGAGVVILEGIDLRAVEPGPCELVCLPLLLEGSDGAPARAVLLARE